MLRLPVPLAEALAAAAGSAAPLALARCRAGRALPLALVGTTLVAGGTGSILVAGGTPVAEGTLIAALLLVTVLLAAGARLGVAKDAATGDSKLADPV